MNTMVKKMMMVLMGSVVSLAAFSQGKADPERMQRDIEVTENILSTLIKQKFEKRSFFPMEVTGEYREGYGVTYRLPSHFNTVDLWNMGSGQNGITIVDGSFSYSFPDAIEPPEHEELEEAEIAKKRATVDRAVAERNRTKANQEMAVANGRNYLTTTSPRKKANTDSMRAVNSQRLIEASKEFIADYGDLITMPGNEKIVITNRGSEGEHIWYGSYNRNSSKPNYLSVEALRSDVADFRQGKINRATLIGKIKVVNTVLDDELQPDLELLSSIFNRLYRSDLSKTFFTEGNMYYERLKDYGVIYYMQVFSSHGGTEGYYNNNRKNNLYSMPTLGLESVTQEERDQKVKEIYPQFEKDIKADILEYGRTLKSLKENEELVFDIRLTKCKGIPSSLELSIKNSVLTEYASGKISKEAAIAKFSVKKGANQ